MQQFKMNEQSCRFANFNPRPELHGKEPKPAADLKLITKVPNDVLDMLDPSLKKALYCYDKKREEEGKTDLVDEGRKHDKDYLPHLRFKALQKQLKWESEIVGAKVTIHHGATEKSHIVLETCLVNEFAFEAQDGGTVVLTVRVQCHPDEEQAGKLYMMVGSEMPVTIAPPVAEEAP